MEAGIAVAGLIAEKTPAGEYAVHPGGMQEVVADKGYHSNDVMVGLAKMEAAQLGRQTGGEASGAGQSAARAG